MIQYSDVLNRQLQRNVYKIIAYEISTKAIGPIYHFVQKNHHQFTHCFYIVKIVCKYILRIWNNMYCVMKIPFLKCPDWFKGHQVLH